MHHPGGRYAIEKNFGTDVGRYLYGVYKLDSNFRVYSHSEYAFNVVKHSVVGELKENYDIREKMLTFKPVSWVVDSREWFRRKRRDGVYQTESKLLH